MRARSPARRVCTLIGGRRTGGPAPPVAHHPNLWQTASSALSSRLWSRRAGRARLPAGLVDPWLTPDAVFWCDRWPGPPCRVEREAPARQLWDYSQRRTAKEMADADAGLRRTGMLARGSRGRAQAQSWPRLGSVVQVEHATSTPRIGAGDPRALDARALEVAASDLRRQRIGVGRAGDQPVA